MQQQEVLQQARTLARALQAIHLLLTSPHLRKSASYNLRRATYSTEIRFLRVIRVIRVQARPRSG